MTPERLAVAQRELLERKPIYLSGVQRDRRRHLYRMLSMSREEKAYWQNRAAFGPQSWWPRLARWGMLFGPWLNSEPWKCGQTR
jgi:hypothetical protein